MWTRDSSASGDKQTAEAAPGRALRGTPKWSSALAAVRPIWRFRSGVVTEVGRGQECEYVNLTILDQQQKGVVIDQIRRFDPKQRGYQQEESLLPILWAVWRTSGMNGSFFWKFLRLETPPAIGCKSPAPLKFSKGFSFREWVHQSYWPHKNACLNGIFWIFLYWYPKYTCLWLKITYGPRMVWQDESRPPETSRGSRWKTVRYISSTNTCSSHRNVFNSEGDPIVILGGKKGGQGYSCQFAPNR